MRVVTLLLAPDGAVLASITVQVTTRWSSTAIAAWSQRHEDPDQIRGRQAEARSVSWRTAPDGMVTPTARLTSDTAGAVCATIDMTVTRANAPAGASLSHQRADALAAVMTGGGGSVTAEVVVHVRRDGNTLTNLQRLCGPHNRAGR